MASQEMYRLGSQSSVIRELFAYGQEQCKIVGKDKVFDFSISNPTVRPRLVSKKQSKIFWRPVNRQPSMVIRQHRATSASVRAWLST